MKDIAQLQQEIDLIKILSKIAQASLDPTELQTVLLDGVVHKMGYERALVGLYDAELDSLTSWLAMERTRTPAPNITNQIAHIDQVSLKSEQGPIAQAIKENRIVEIIDGTAPTSDSQINLRLVQGVHYAIFPLLLRDQLIGVFLLDQLPAHQPLSEAERQLFEHLTIQVAIALGNIQIGLMQTQDEAIAIERQRIATDLHDNVSQALYGVAYGLQAVSQHLTTEPQLQEMLNTLHCSVVEAQDQIRQTIFNMRQPDEVTSELFVAGLHRHLRSLAHLSSVSLKIDLSADFDQWDYVIRQELYRVIREALTNTIKHAQAQQAIVKLTRYQDYIELRIADDGDGFATEDRDDAQHLGLNSMTERIQALHGTLEISSVYGEGTLLIAQVPYPPVKKSEVEDSYKPASLLTEFNS